MATSRWAFAILSPVATLAFLCASGCRGSVAAGEPDAAGTPPCTTAPCPVTLASGYYPVTIAVDATNVYWGNAGCTSAPTDGDRSVMSVPVGGGTVTTLASNQDPVVLTVDATNVYWTNAFGCSTGGPGAAHEGSGTVMKVPRDGGTPTQLVPWAPYSPQGIAVDATNVYWANFQGTGAVQAAPIVGGTPNTLVPFPQGTGPGSAYGAITVDATNLYWATRSAVSSLPLGGGTLTTLWQGPPVLGASAVDAENVYWGTSDGSVMKVPKSGGAPSTLASGLGGVRCMAVDSKNVYWASYANSMGPAALMRMPLGGGTPTTLASDQSIVAIAVDATSVYWAGDRAVMKLTPK